MELIERFRNAAERSLDAIKHCDLRHPEQEAAHRLRTTLKVEWSVQDMNTVINADTRINRPIGGRLNPEP